MSSNMTLGRKIGMLAASLAALCLTLGAVTLLCLARIEHTVSRLAVDAVPGLESVGNIAASVYRFRGDAWKHIASLSPDDTAEIEREMDALKVETEQNCGSYERRIQLAVDRTNFAQFRESLASYYKAWDTDVRPISHDHRTMEAYDLYLKTADAPFRELNNHLRKLTRWNADRGRVASVDATTTSTWARILTWVLLLSSVTIGGSLSFFILRGLIRALREAMFELGGSADQVASAASQLASSSQSLAQGASEQAASLVETSSSSEQIHATARQNTERLNAASALVAATQLKFSQTSGALEQMVQAMGEISASSDKISRIIKVIDEIAFQTNILALNAAVEAARAGESGMGFAVVAGEVRNLAQRSAQAAKDTETLIQESIAKSIDGKCKVDQVALSIRAITEEANQVKELMDQVNCGSQEQAQGIAQISRAIAEMERMTQRTASSGEESASASEELTAQSHALKDIVGRLRLMVEGGHAAQARMAHTA